jgi:hypothetical protein
VPEWLQTGLAIVIGLLAGYGGHWLQAKTATTDNERALRDSRRIEALDTLRWAAELAVSDREAQRRLGATMLTQLVHDEHLAPADLRRVRAAIQASLLPKLERVAREDEPDVALPYDAGEEEQ